MNECELQGINHIALVCKDVARTVDFYTKTLGFKLIKTIALPDGSKRFFFDIGNGSALVFLWFPKAPDASPGIASVKPEAIEAMASVTPKTLTPKTLKASDIATAHGSMNHLAFNVPLEKLQEYREKLLSKGVQVTPILHHADVPSGYAPELDDTTLLSSFYFFDPDGILLQVAATVREF
ncbi:MAG: VOC family protein [Moorea sp. SIOASIH]|uniref:VOC family protein n=1 Tax=unclassified Moorena TaxID=2683338 RepID=UPI0013BB5B33|nr:MULTISPECIES: VOC family protein [unclassified Moorena]NEO40918.1 VOC family protein [Moorena sp. SIOASIH]NEO79899.1 VOC family protein [Moorena sp. SIO4G3]NEO90204.1 VOC family protein [Moorena sp. SIO3G5]